MKDDMVMPQPFISVVMPIYNAQDHLECAVRSIQEQTFADFEILLVNDCSTDQSGEICERLAQKDHRIRVIHREENGGPSFTRNTGLAQANGRYIFFMDADDVVDSTLFEQAVESLRENPAQVVVFGLIEEYYDEKGALHHSVPLRYGSEKRLTSAADLRSEVIHLEEKTFYGYPWNKLYDAAYLRQVGTTFENVTLNEDIQFNVKVFQDIDRLNILNAMPYHYKKRLDGASVTSKFVPEYFALHRWRVQMLADQHREWGLLTDEVKRILAGIYVRYIFSALQRNCDPRSGMGRRERKEFIRELYQDPLFQELIPYARGNSRIVRLLADWLRGQHTTMSLWAGRGIYLVKNRLPMVFARVKQNR